MRCDYCPLSGQEDGCPENESEYGIEHKDGMAGCKHPWSWVEKRDREYSEYLGDMGTDMGIEHDFPGEKLSQLIEICKHMIGLDYQKPYVRKILQNTNGLFKRNAHLQNGRCIRQQWLL